MTCELLTPQIFFVAGGKCICRTTASESEVALDMDTAFACERACCSIIPASWLWLGAYVSSAGICQPKDSPPPSVPNFDVMLHSMNMALSSPGISGVTGQWK